VISPLSPHSLVALLADAAAGRFPAQDGAVLVTGPPPGPVHAVVGFTGFHVIASSAPEKAIRGWLDPEEDLGAPMDAAFLTWLGDRIGRRAGTLDAVLAITGTGDHPGWERSDDDHPRVRRARRYRDTVAVYRSGPGRVMVGNGLAGRYEVAIDVERTERDRGLGSWLAAGARGLVPSGAALFAQVAPGNTASLRAFLRAGYRPIGSEVLFPPV